MSQTASNQEDVRDDSPDQSTLSRGPTGWKYDVFISFSSKDEDASKVVYHRLVKDLNKQPKDGSARESARIFWSARSLKPSDDWNRNIVRALDEVRCFVLLLSKNSLESKWVVREVQAAVKRRDDKTKNLPVLVFRLDGSIVKGDLELLLEEIHKVNETPGERDEDLKKLVRCVREALDRQPETVTWLEGVIDWVQETLTRIPTKVIKIVVPLLLAALLGGGGYALRDRVFRPPDVIPPPNVPNVPRPPIAVYRTNGVVEISRTSIREFGANLVSLGNEPFRVSNDGVPLMTTVDTVKHELKRKLAYTKGQRQFDPSSVQTVVDGVAELIQDLDSKGIKKDNVLIVISSGVRQIPDAEVAKSCVEHLITELKTKVGGNVSVEEISPVAEAGFLLKEVLRNNELAREQNDPHWDKDLMAGDVVAIDVGSGNIKGAYYNPGNGKVGTYDLPQVSGIMSGVPGVRTLTDKVLEGTGAALSPTQLDLLFNRHAAEWVRGPLRIAAEDTPMLEESSRAYLSGGAPWAMCRLARPDIDLDERYVQVRPEDFQLFRSRVANEDDGLTDYPPTLSSDAPYYIELLARTSKRKPGQEKRYRDQLNGVKSAFGKTGRAQLIAAAALLVELDKTLLHSGRKDRKVYFINEGTFDWLTSYLIWKVNESQRPR